MENQGGSWGRRRGQGRGPGRSQGQGQGRGRGQGQGQGRGDNRGYSHPAQDQIWVDHFPSSGAKKQGQRPKERGSVSMLHLGALQSENGTRAYQNAPKNGREWEDGHYHLQERHLHSCEGRQFLPSARDRWQVDFDGGGATHPPPSYEESNRRERARGFGIAPHIGPNPDVFFPGRTHLPPSSSCASLPSAPPSYMWSDRAAPLEPRDNGGHSQRGRSTLSVADVVKCLSQFREEWGSGEVVSRHLDCSIEKLQETVTSRPDIFSWMEQDGEIVVELLPKVSLCPAYLKETGCTTRAVCEGLHMCRPFITHSGCDLGTACPYGHRLDTNHNTSVLSKLYLDLIDKNVAFSLIRKVLKGKDSARVCKLYNNTRGCEKERCLDLHVCKDYVQNAGQCFQRNCPLNHNILSEGCKKVLKCYGVSLNDSIRDILLTLKMDDFPEIDNSPSSVDSHDRKSRRKKDLKDQAKVDKQAVHPAGNRGGNNEVRQQDCQRKTRKENDRTTRQSTDVFGDVEIPEICVHFLNDRCLKEGEGCQYLHAKSTFHWHLRKDARWYNLRVNHSKALESAFRDVAKDGVQLEALIPERIGLQGKELFKILGQDLWTANFTQMNLKSPSRTEIWEIRRVATPSAAISKNPRATVYNWYFLDSGGKWVAFGDVDSLGRKEMACTITSEEIEQRFLNQPSSGMAIKNSRYTYLLNFGQMTQTNTSTKKVREIRRRPAKLLYAKKTGGGPWESGPNYPPHWTPIPAGENHLLVNLRVNEAEYKGISSRLTATLPTAKIQKIQRLQNPYLWHHLQEKKKNFCKKYGERQLNMQKLFYGNVCDPSCIEAICRENLDWRREMAKSSRPYGQGTYFYNSAALASRNSTTAVSGHLTVILADVIVGSIVKGKPDLSRPPVNEFTKDLYDTTVDDLSAPSTFVKYEKCEYYPEYFIEFL